MRTQEIFQIQRDFRFEAAHRLPQLPSDHKCHRLHGHSFRFTVVIEDRLQEDKGWVLDYGELRQKIEPLVKETLDHRYLNEIPGLENPTSENIARWLWQRIEAVLPNLKEIIVAETCDTACRYRKENSQ